MPSKVCEVVSAQELIRAREGGGSEATERPKPSIIPHRSCRGKPSYFPMIFEALKSPEPTLRLPSQKVSSSSASSRNSRQVTDRSGGQVTNRRAKAIAAGGRWARHLPR